MTLAVRGDHVLWHGPTYSHSWRSDAGCTFLSARWPVDPPAAGHLPTVAP